MTEEACRTRSQKRALDPDPGEDDVESKKIKMERGLSASEVNMDGDSRVTPEPGASPAPGLMRAAEDTAVGRGEGLVGDGPVDMRTSHSDMKPEKRPPSPDVIVLSDNEQPSSPRVNGLAKLALEETGTEALLKSSPEDREQMIKQLKEELRLEEAKLVLLKKLRQSQIQKEATAQKPAGSAGSAVTTPPPLVRGTQNIPASKTSLQTSARMPSSVIPPPLVRGGQQVSSKLGPQASSQVVMPPLVRGAQQIHNIRQHSTTGPPPLLLAPRASVPSVQIQGQRIIQQGLIRVANVPNTSLLVNIPQPTAASLKGTSATSAQANSTPSSVASVVAAAESPASRQAAAKLALRKQLEKTLLEIPPPKPPAPEMTFLPSAANNEFIYLVGLEEVVHNLLETQAGRLSVATAVLSREPYTCAQCKTDFTCRWREEKGGAVMCETCMTSNQKKALKVEHTSRLKAAFVKALQQEQEIEQRLLQQGPGTGPPAAKAEPSAPHPVLKQTSSQLARGSATSRGVLHTFSQSPKLQNTASPTALVSRTGRHSERGSSRGAASNWKKTPLSTGGTLAFVSPSLAVHKTSSTVDRQREYLLDMIPPRSIPQSATWK
ncbi:transcriptional repressor p66-alpha isoform X2 [Perognathus longimembris pacificus]|uniref:transcriptional repressor p66-alpha isoform X2 n=1 Tax=Perognathus longimembris pacificus TaxID=214514 RepID=UPI00201928FF|nr:transcriptional repressor p66-alpha isoform X2 [Perognathus longimembris pacificus]